MNRFWREIGIVAVAYVFTIVACSGGDDHEHGDDHGHGERGHGEHDHGDNHGHSGEPTSITNFTDETELFVEIPRLIVGEESAIAAHMTRLRDNAPVERGTLVVEFSGAGAQDERFSAMRADSPGIYRPLLKPTMPGLRTVVVRLQNDTVDVTHDLGMIPVYASAEEASSAHDEHEHVDSEGYVISFLKEQQWRMAFATQEARMHKIRPSFEAYATIRARTDGEARVVAPVAGRLSSGRWFPRLGARVARGDMLMSLTPRLADAGDSAALKQEVERTRIEIEQAERERERLDGLFADGAIPERRLIEARFDEKQARAAHATAKQRLQQARTVQSPKSGSRGAMQVRAPLKGNVISIDAVPGAFVGEGTSLVHIIDLDRLWLEVHVAETHAGYLSTPRGVWFEIEGFDKVFEVGPDDLVTIGGVVDERARTIPLIMALDNPDGQLRVGMFAQAHVLIEDPYDALAVPVSAVLYESGLPVVYVQLSGESFVRRTVRLGATDKDVIEIREGVHAGERVVTKGAYAVRLAASADSIPEHGHHH